MTTRRACKHSRPFLGNETCEIGINFRALVGGSDLGWLQRLPCVTTELSCDQAECPKREYRTEEEEAERDAEVTRAGRLFDAGLSACCEAVLRRDGTARFCSACSKWCGRVCFPNHEHEHTES